MSWIAAWPVVDVPHHRFDALSAPPAVLMSRASAFSQAMDVPQAGQPASSAPGPAAASLEHLMLLSPSIAIVLDASRSAPPPAANPAFASATLAEPSYLPDHGNEISPPDPPGHQHEPAAVTGGSGSFASPRDGESQGGLVPVSPSTSAIQMDVGVGLSQAFELASSPVEQTAQPEAASADGNVPDPQTNSAACAAPDAEPMAGQSAGAEDPTDQSVQRAVATPVILAAAFLLKGAARKRTDEESSELENGPEGSSR